MPALEPRSIEARHVPHHRDARFALHRLAELRIVRGRHAVEDDPRHLRRLAKPRKACHLGGNGECATARVHHEHHGRTRRARHVVRRGRVGRGDAVVVAHDALDERDISRLLATSNESPHEVRRPQKEVEVARGHAEHLLVKRRVEVVGPHLAGAHGKSTGLEQGEQAARNGGLARAARRPRNHEARRVQAHASASPRPHAPRGHRRISRRRGWRPP